MRDEIKKIILETPHMNEGIDKIIALFKDYIDISDDKLADRVGRDCYDTMHDERWCPTCEARCAGIDVYRQTLKDLIEEEK